MHIQWLTGLLRLAVQAGGLPPSAVTIDHNSQAALMNSEIWPKETPMTEDLGSLLEKLAPMYPKFIHKWR